MLTARAASKTRIVRERMASIIIEALAVRVRGIVSVGLKAVAPVKARKR
jgi:hypothetical protein